MVLYIVKITDFGLAKDLESEISGGHCMTGQLGTIAFMAPEVLQLSGGRTGDYEGAAVDCWGLGCILYMMATCMFPFGTDQKPARHARSRAGDAGKYAHRKM